ncbi:Sulphatase-modifying factor protein [filamentous cyanobacterium CCT1]|nr:Sulphatase-modifying factor protein [filamentous cyanobacterium CCT1]PSN81317.1 Sulphatase-modifying factor protein [filamentous cyanobacterium CCP4]
MENQDLPEDVQELIKQLPKERQETIEEITQSAVRYMESVILPRQEFVYPKTQELSQTPLRKDIQHQTLEFDTVFLEGDEIKTVRKTAQYFTEELGSDTKLDMILIPNGEFTMGSPEDDIYVCSPPLHKVTVSEFYIGKFQVTQKQWKAIMQHNLSAHEGDNLPVENVSWCDAVEFCARISALTGRNYRLPSEAEWEYACRAGTTTYYSFGSKISTRLANYWDMDASESSPIEAPIPSEGCVAAYNPDGVQYLQTVPVGSYFPNAFGLYDMHGNVYELCQDAWHYDYTGAPNDGSAWGTGYDDGLVVIRGGSFDYYDFNCCSAFRSDTGISYRYHGTGFRIACSVSNVE